MQPTDKLMSSLYIMCSCLTLEEDISVNLINVRSFTVFRRFQNASEEWLRIIKTLDMLSH